MFDVYLPPMTMRSGYQYTRIEETFEYTTTIENEITLNKLELTIFHIRFRG